MHSIEELIYESNKLRSLIFIVEGPPFHVSFLEYILSNEIVY